MPVLSRSVDVAAPVERVWALLEDVRRLPEFSPSTEAVEDAPPRLTATGQTYVQVGTLLGRRYRSRWEVVALAPPHLLASEGSPGLGVSYRITQRLEAAGAGSRLTVELDYRVPGGPLGRLAARAGVEALAARNVEAVLDGIARVVTAG